jgi:hypothetical protein
MQTTEIIAQLDAEISRLQQVKVLLNGTTTKRSPGRPAASVTAAAPVTTAAPKKRILSPEARAKMAAAQKKRWAKVRKDAK